MTSEDLKALVARRIVECRDARGWSSSELARRMGKAPGNIGDYEHGRRSPGLDVIAKLAAVFGVKPATLLTERKKSSKSA